MIDYNNFLETMPIPFLYCTKNIDNDGHSNLKIQHLNDKCIEISNSLDKSIENKYITDVFKAIDIKELHAAIESQEAMTIQLMDSDLSKEIKLSFQVLKDSIIIVYITYSSENIKYKEIEKEENIILHTEEKYKQLKEINNVLTEISNKALIFRDISGIIIDCNEKCLKYFDFNKSDLIGKSLYEYCEDEFIDFILKTDREVIKEKKKMTYVKDLVRNGKQYIFEIVKCPFNDKNGHTTGIFESIEDITYKEELNVQKFDFITTVSHELRTPLNLIFTSLHVLRRLHNDKLDELNINKYIDAIYVNSNRLLKFSNNIIDVQKLELGLDNDYIIKDNIVPYIQLIAKRVGNVAIKKNLTLVFDKDIENKEMCFDLEKLEKILLNVLSNSIKYNTPNGKILIKLSDNEDGIKITIKDTGVGIEKKLLQDIYEQFKNLQNRFNKIAEGSGLGLYITKKLIDSQNGKIEVESELNYGTAFTITLPSRKYIEINESKKSIEDYNQGICSRINVELSDII